MFGCSISTPRGEIRLNILYLSQYCGTEKHERMAQKTETKQLLKDNAKISISVEHAKFASRLPREANTTEFGGKYWNATICISSLSLNLYFIPQEIRISRCSVRLHFPRAANTRTHARAVTKRTSAEFWIPRQH